jgi:hypothetical protein
MGVNKKILSVQDGMSKAYIYFRSLDTRAIADTIFIAIVEWLTNIKEPRKQAPPCAEPNNMMGGI